MNQPYLPTSLSPAEELLLSRVTAAETALGALAQLLTKHSPALADEINRIVQSATAQAKTGEELAAAVYLDSLRHPDATARVTAAELLAPSIKMLAPFDAWLAEYFPAKFGALLPLAIQPQALYGDPASFIPLTESGAKPTYAELHEVLFHLPERGVKVTGSLLSGGRSVQPLLIRAIGPHYIVINAMDGQWALLTLDATNQHYFTHHQLAYLDDPRIQRTNGTDGGQAWDADQVMMNFFASLLKTLPSRVLSYYGSASFPHTKLEVVLAKVFKTAKPQQLETGIKGLLKAKLSLGNLQQMGNRKALIVESPDSPLTMLFTEGDLETVMIGTPQGGMQPCKVADLPAVSVNLLLDLLPELLGLPVKDAKASPKRVENKELIQDFVDKKMGTGAPAKKTATRKGTRGVIKKAH